MRACVALGVVSFAARWNKFCVLNLASAPLASWPSRDCGTESFIEKLAVRE
jgi:hypothetical protein